jgi:DNA polymerase
MPRERKKTGREPLTDVLSYYKDLGVTELHLPPGRSARRETAQVKAAPVPAGPPESEQAPSGSAAGQPPSAPSKAPAPPARKAAGESEGSAVTLSSLASAVASCERCPLSKTRTQTVFADGTGPARIMFIGEAPGADEDAQGIPFVGRAGQLLTKMIENGMGIPRSDVYIANVLKCRPPGNRNPEPEEIAACRGYLETQIDLVRPEVLVALGNFAAKFLLETEEGIMRLRGKWGEYRGIPVMPTYHPSFLLRQPDRKRDAWADLLAVLARLGVSAPPAGGR